MRHIGGGVPHDIHRHASLFGQGKGLCYLRIVGLKAQDARHERLVGAVPAARGRERAVQGQDDALRLLAEQRARRGRDAKSAGCVRAGRAHHNGADNVP